MSKYFFTLNLEYYICEYILVHDLFHVGDQVMGCLCGYLVHFHFTDIQYTNIIKPFASIKSTKDEQLLCANHTGCMSLPPNWCFVNLNRVTPFHGFCIQNVEII